MYIIDNFVRFLALSMASSDRRLGQEFGVW